MSLKKFINIIFIECVIIIRILRAIFVSLFDGGEISIDTFKLGV
jgi:hypothetical protein